MTPLAPALRELRENCRDLAGELRALALPLDADPQNTGPLLGSAALELLRHIGTPRDFRACDVPDWAEHFTASCLGRVVANIELARGDAGVLNACATPSLAGFTVDALGDKAQQEQFYDVLTRQRPWTFFAMTEPDHGSDATSMETRLDRSPDGGYRLHGRKRYVANAARGGIGVVFARTGPTVLGIRAALLRLPAPGFTGAALEMTGLRGACIGEMTFDAVAVPREQLLGGHLPASKRGLWGAGRAFTVVRLQIAAQALGVACAIRDLVCGLRPGWTGHEVLSARLAAARELLHDTARRVDAGPDDRRPSALAKLHTSGLAVEAGRWAEAALGPGALLEHPLLEKWCRDVGAFEFMDGTSNILRLTLAPSPGHRREGR